MTSRLKSTTNRGSNITGNIVRKKDLWILRHGQATHNVRAEFAKSNNNCSHEEFLHLMEQDDSLDSLLTEVGIQQAMKVRDTYFPSSTMLPPSPPPPPSPSPPPQQQQQQQRHYPNTIISSPLSRALQTADVVIPPYQLSSQVGTSTTSTTTNRICYEGFREINGHLFNAKRRTRTELQTTFPHWDFTTIQSDDDILWTPTYESYDDCARRGLLAFEWLCKLSPFITNTSIPTMNTINHGNYTHLENATDMKTTPATTILETSSSSSSSTTTTTTTVQEDPQHRVLLVCHGGLLRFVMERAERCRDDDDNIDNQHHQWDQSDDNLPRLLLRDGRNHSIHKEPIRLIDTRFENCELRRYRIEYSSSSSISTSSNESAGDVLHNDMVDNASNDVEINNNSWHRTIVMTEVDL